MIRMARRWPLAAAIVVVLVAGFAARWWLARQATAGHADPATVALASQAVWAVTIAGLVSVALSSLALEWRRGRLEGELARARDELTRQAAQEADRQRLNLLGTLAAGLAHELGQPLSVARVGIEGIHYLRQIGREPDAEHVQRTLSRVGMSVLAMTQTIEHLRGLANPDVPAATAPLDLGGCVAAVLAERDHWSRFTDTRVLWERPDHPVNARGDVAGLRLILVNLLRNAVEAVSGQGEDRRLVRITVGPGPTVSVHDSGPGIPAEVLARLFDPFFTTKSGATRGIGLSLAKASAARMGATLEVASTVGSGTVFTLRLAPARRGASS